MSLESAYRGKCLFLSCCVWRQALLRHVSVAFVLPRIEAGTFTTCQCRICPVAYGSRHFYGMRISFLSCHVWRLALLRHASVAFVLPRLEEGTFTTSECHSCRRLQRHALFTNKDCREKKVTSTKRGEIRSLLASFFKVRKKCRRLYLRVHSCHFAAVISGV